MLRYLRSVQCSKSLDWIMYERIIFISEQNHQLIIMKLCFFTIGHVTFLYSEMSDFRKYASEDFKLWSQPQRLEAWKLFILKT